MLRSSLIYQAINVAHSNASVRNDYGEIRNAIIGVIFLGTPHHGSATSTMGSYLTRIFGILLGADGYLLRSLEKNHPALASAHSTFVDLCRAQVQRQVGWNDTSLDLWEHSKCFYETKPTMLICGLISLGKVCISSQFVTNGTLLTSPRLSRSSPQLLTIVAQFNLTKTTPA